LFVFIKQVYHDARSRECERSINLLKPTCHVMHHQFNIQQSYALPPLYLCVLYLSENKEATCATYSINWLVFHNRDEKCLQRGTDWVFK